MWNRIFTGALALGCVLLGIALLLGEKGREEPSKILNVPLQKASLPMRTPESNAIAEQMLERRITDLDLSSTTLKDAIDKIGTGTGANIAVHWDDLEARQRGRDSKVDVRLRNVSVETALRILLETQLSRSSISFVPAGDVIVISDADNLRDYSVLAIYDVRDLLQAFHDPSLTSPPDPREAIMRLVTGEVAPDGWLDHGGSEGIIYELGGFLVIRQTPANHHKIAALLEMLRERTHHSLTTRPASEP